MSDGAPLATASPVSIREKPHRPFVRVHRALHPSTNLVAAALNPECSEGGEVGYVADASFETPSNLTSCLHSIAFGTAPQASDTSQLYFAMRSLECCALMKKRSRRAQLHKPSKRRRRHSTGTAFIGQGLRCPIRQHVQERASVRHFRFPFAEIGLLIVFEAEVRIGQNL